MSIHTYVTEQDLKRWGHVSDPDLDVLYQEIKELSGNRILLEEKIIWSKRFLRKPIKKVLYTIYNWSGGMDAQIINFAQDHKWSINTSVTESYIYTYFYGYFNGHHQGKAYDLINSNTKP